jgi:hypothetical protein
MPKVQVTSQIEIDFEEVLKGIAQLEPDELEQFADKVIALRAQRRVPNLPKNEAELLQKINRGMSPEVYKRYEELNAKLHEDTIIPNEHQELLRLIDQIELADVERMRHLITLAQLRQISVDTLMDQLGIRRPVYG